MSEKRRLNLVDTNEVLQGQGPSLFEQLSRGAKAGSRDHLGLINITTTLAARCTAVCVPPTAQAELATGLAVARLWLTGEASKSDAEKARATCFQAVTAIEELTSQAVEKAKPHLPKGPQTPLDHHADHVVDRYARLAAHFSTSAICHVLDGISEVERCLDVFQDVEGARAYQATGLGSARHSAFRKAAWDQGSWEVSRPGTSPGDSLEQRKASVALQVFHEYLGGRWRAHADSQRAQNTQFVNWALSGRQA